MTSLLAVRGVKTYYGKIVALKGVDVDVADGEIVRLSIYADVVSFQQQIGV